MEKNWLEKAFEEAKNHLSPELMEDYSTNKDNLSKEDIQKVEDHTKSCTRCAHQID